MYVLIHKERVLVGPMVWNYAMFEGALEKINIDFTLTRSEPEVLPIVIDDYTRITKAREVVPDHNPLTETYYGPFWDFSGDVAIGTYQVKPREISQIQEILIKKAADERYSKENNFIKATIKGTEVTLDARRESRNQYIQQYMSMEDSDIVNWKFIEGWLTLTKSEFHDVVKACAAHTQNAFNWEKNKVDEILSTTTAEELNNIVIRPTENTGN